MILQKTAKAQEELQPGSRQLPQRARSLLLVAGGFLASIIFFATPPC